MARELISVSSISINDLNDAVVSGTAPSNPDDGMLWLNDNVLKQYTNGRWQTVTLDILRMDEVLKTTINSIENTLGNISADGNLSFVDREVVSQNVGEIIGEMFLSILYLRPFGKISLSNTYCKARCKYRPFR